jgi:hypothetical protein
MSTTQTDELITAQQYADEMGVTLRHVYQMRYLGTGPVSHIRSGRIVSGAATSTPTLSVSGCGRCGVRES